MAQFSAKISHTASRRLMASVYPSAVLFVLTKSMCKKFCNFDRLMIVLPTSGNMDIKKLKERYRRFREWKQQPHKVEPLSTEQHACANCGMQYEGNFCPRCGQSSRVGRYSFKNAFLLFLDVWGLGSRGIFRTVRDLLLRPGYLIRDYLKGMQMSYYPPFKLFFLLFALALLMDTGLNIRLENRYADKKDKEVKITLTSPEPETSAVAEAGPESAASTAEVVSPKSEVSPQAEQDADSEELDKEARKNAVAEDFSKRFTSIFQWMDNHISIVILVLLLLFSCPLCLLFRHCPAIPDLRLSECFIAMVYISNMLLIYGLVPSFLCFSSNVELVYGLLTFLLINVPIKQLSGYGYWGTFWRVFLAAASLVVVLLSLLVLGIYLYVALVYA